MPSTSARHGTARRDQACSLRAPIDIAVALLRGAAIEAGRGLTRARPQGTRGLSSGHRWQGHVAELVARLLQSVTNCIRSSLFRFCLGTS